MSFLVRPLRDDEALAYLEIVNSAIRGLAMGHYSPEQIDGWLVSLDEDRLEEFRRNEDGEVRLVAELNGSPVGIGAVAAELRACYVVPGVSRQGCGCALVREIERIATAQRVEKLWLAASLNAEAFYRAQGYRVTQRKPVTLRNGAELPAVFMEKQLVP
jgi:putative acetyltransferase